MAGAHARSIELQHALDPLWLPTCVFLSSSPCALLSVISCVHSLAVFSHYAYKLFLALGESWGIWGIPPWGCVG